MLRAAMSDFGSESVKEMQYLGNILLAKLRHVSHL
jgi:hypothetical protein